MFPGIPILYDVISLYLSIEIDLLNCSSHLISHTDLPIH
jgi:hypothetical protein